MTIAITPAMAEAKRLREAMGVTQADISRRAGWDVTSVRRWEKGKQQPTLQSFSNYLEALGLRIKIEPIQSEEHSA